MVYDRSMEMDGPCAVYRCMRDGKLENVEFFFYFFGRSRTFTCWGYVQFFISVVSISSVNKHYENQDISDPTRRKY